MLHFCERLPAGRPKRPTVIRGEMGSFFFQWKPHATYEGRRHSCKEQQTPHPQALHLKPEGSLPSVYIVEMAADPALISSKTPAHRDRFLPGRPSPKNYSYTTIKKGSYRSLNFHTVIIIYKVRSLLPCWPRINMAKHSTYLVVSGSAQLGCQPSSWLKVKNIFFFLKASCFCVLSGLFTPFSSIPPPLEF